MAEKRTSLRSCAALTLTALIWGLAFIAQSVGMDYVGPFTFNAIRSALGALALLPVAALLRKKAGAGRLDWKPLIAGGAACGAALFVASSLQQFGIKYTTAGKAGFITALYVVIVPVIGVFLRKKTPLTVWISAAVAAAGLYLLCIKEGFSIGKGDLYVMLCAVAFSGHIMLVDHFSRRTDPVCLSCAQFFVCGVMGVAPMFIFEQPQAASIAQCWLPIAYAGVLSCAAGYTLQIVGQREADPTVASLIMSLEAVFAAVFGWLLLRQGLTGRELAGSALVFGAIVLAQLPRRERAGRYKRVVKRAKIL